MTISRIRNLLLINTIALIFIWSCKTHSPQKTKDVNLPEPFLAHTDSSLIYRASFDFKDNHFSGLTVIKKHVNNALRVVFLSEVGLTLMDVEISKDQFTVHKTFDFLDKKVIMSFIENDFRLMLMTNLLYKGQVKQISQHDGKTIYKVKGKLKVEYYLDDEHKIITRSIRRGSFNTRKAIVTYKYNKDHIPNEIILERTNVDMDLKLSLLKKL